MQNFEFFTPTRMIFGKDTHLQAGKLVKEYGFKKVLVHFGGASARKTGLLDAVLDSLKEEGIEYVTLGGVQANPTPVSYTHLSRLRMRWQRSIILRLTRPEGSGI